MNFNQAAKAIQLLDSITEQMMITIKAHQEVLVKHAEAIKEIKLVIIKKHKDIEKLTEITRMHTDQLESIINILDNMTKERQRQADLVVYNSGNKTAH
jgi:tRNA/tmRNA/rRNA uracil-C5-methylase (TrmA/RlmC/RlmD family)